MAGSHPKGEISDRLKSLTPAQRALLERRLMERRAAEARERPLARREGSGPVPLSHAQELLYLLSQVFDDGVAYNAPGAYRLEGPLGLPALEAALVELVRRHEILRTTYRVINGVPMQVVGDDPVVGLNVVDITDVPAERRDAE